MNKLKYIVAAAPVAVAGSAFAQASGSTIDLTPVTTAATTIQTTLTDFFTDTLVPLVVAVAGLSLTAYLVIALFRWARKLGK